MSSDSFKIMLPTNYLLTNFIYISVEKLITTIQVEGMIY